MNYLNSREASLRSPPSRLGRTKFEIIYKSFYWNKTRNGCLAVFYIITETHFCRGGYNKLSHAQIHARGTQKAHALFLLLGNRYIEINYLKFRKKSNTLAVLFFNMFLEVSSSGKIVDLGCFHICYIYFCKNFHANKTFYWSWSLNCSESLPAWNRHY